jgi:hypothetical protein
MTILEDLVEKAGSIDKLIADLKNPNQISSPELFKNQYFEDLEKAKLKLHDLAFDVGSKSQGDILNKGIEVFNHFELQISALAQVLSQSGYSISRAHEPSETDQTGSKWGSKMTNSSDDDDIPGSPGLQISSLSQDYLDRYANLDSSADCDTRLFWFI